MVLILRRYKWLLFLLFAAQIADGILTRLTIAVGGHECNPLAIGVTGEAGWYWLAKAGLSLVLVGILVWLMTQEPKVIWLVRGYVVLLGFLCVWNAYQYLGVS